VLVVFALERGGYAPSTWYPATLFLLAALVLAAVGLPRASATPWPSAAAAALLFAYAGWSYLTIAWADQEGIAWDGANRSALYAVVFALFALWPLRARPAAVVMGVIAFAIAVIGLGELIGAAASSEPERWFIVGRFAEPAGYTNANVALWMVAFFPCIALAASRSIPPGIRAAALAAAVVAGELALLGQSRAWQFAAPIAALVFIAVARERMRVAITLLAVVAAGALAAPAVLDVYDTVLSGAPIGPAMDAARDATLIAAAVLGVLGLVVALLDRRYTVPESTARAATSGLAGVAVAAVVLGVAFVVTQGDLGSRVSRAWDTFVQGTEPKGTSSRFGVTLGSQRVDVWKVSWRQFESAPLTGVGADNFQQDYLRERKSGQEPRYPHSVVMRTLGQTGLIGTLLLGAALLICGIGAWRALRGRPRGVGAAAAAGGVAVFTYWLVHASVDWLYEYAGVAALAFAAIGLACGLQPRAPRPPPRPRRAPARRSALGIAGAAGAVLLALSLLGPWLAERYVAAASGKWQERPQAAFDDLSKAASLNPLSPRPQLAAGTIALELGQEEEARRHFSEALERDERDTYALLQLAVLTANAGDRERGQALLERAHALNPRDELLATTLRRMENRRRIDLADVNDAILRRARLQLRVRP
jgi:hypothetical protein